MNALNDIPVVRRASCIEDAVLIRKVSRKIWTLHEDEVDLLRKFQPISGSETSAVLMDMEICECSHLISSETGSWLPTQYGDRKPGCGG